MCGRRFFVSVAWHKAVVAPPLRCVFFMKWRMSEAGLCGCLCIRMRSRFFLMLRNRSVLLKNNGQTVRRHSFFRYICRGQYALAVAQNVAVCSLSVVFCLRLTLVCKSIMPVAEAVLLYQAPLLLPSALPIHNLNNHVCVSVTVSIVLSHVCGTQL